MPPEERQRVSCHLDALLAERGMTLTELADKVGVTVVNLSMLKNNRANRSTGSRPAHHPR